MVQDNQPNIELPQLPNNWRWSSLGNLGLVRLGKTPRKADYRDQGDYKIVKFRDVDETGKIDWENNDKGYVSSSPEVLRTLQELREGDVLVTASAHMSEHIGKKVGFALSIPRKHKGVFVVGELLQIRTSEGIEPRWVYYYLGSRDGYKAIQRRVHGVHLIGSRAQHIEIPLAPPEDQQRIVAEIEKQFSRLDEAVASLKRTKANLKRYKAAVLKAAVEGKLTEDWRKQHRDGEPASKLLERILAERRVRWNGRGRYKEPVIHSSANSTPLPEGWCWATLDQTVWHLRSGTAETSKREPTEYPVLKSSAVRQGTIDFTDLNYLQKLQSVRPENFIKRGDLLITRLSGSVDYVGCSAVVKSSLCEGIQYPDRIFCGKLLTGVDGTYLSYCFQHPRIRKILEGAAKSTAGHQRISMSDLYPLALPLPPTAEQVHIVAEVERRLSVIEELEATVEANLTRANRLRQTILQQAFSGRLLSPRANDSILNFSEATIPQLSSDGSSVG